MSAKSTTAILCVAALAALTACIPNQKLKAPHQSPAVTGPFEVYFPDAEVIFTGPESIAEVERKKRKEEESTIVEDMGSLEIGLLIPKTGANAALGKDFEDSAILALYDAKLAFPGGYRLTLLPTDTAGSPSVAVDAAQSLSDKGIGIMVGPLYSQSTEAIATTVNPDLMLSLSNNSDAALGNSFVYGFTPEAEMLRGLAYALKQNNNRVAAILPNNKYGRKLERVIRNTVPGFGANLDAIEFYVTTDEGRKAAATRLAQRIKSVSTGIVCFGDTKENSAQIIKDMREAGVDVTGATKVGTSLWHDLEQPTPNVLQSTIYAASDDRSYNRFMKRFKSAHGRVPSRLGVLIYDAITLLAEIASQGTVPDRSTLMAIEIIQGPAAGSYRFESDGSLMRALALYELTPTSYKVIENAPKSF